MSGQQFEKASKIIMHFQEKMYHISTKMYISHSRNIQTINLLSVKLRESTELSQKYGDTTIRRYAITRGGSWLFYIYLRIIL